MKNLEQIRAKNALAAASGTVFKGAEDGEVAKKVPTMIRDNGILGALAFAVENQSKTDHADIFRAVIAHLKELKKLPGTGNETLEGFMSDLCASDSVTLRHVTAEAMAYLNYLRRFAKKGD